MLRSLIRLAAGGLTLLLLSAPAAQAERYCYNDRQTGQRICLDPAPQGSPETSYLCPFCAPGLPGPQYPHPGSPPPPWGGAAPLRPAEAPTPAPPPSLVAAAPGEGQPLDITGADGSLRACYVNGGMVWKSSDLAYVCTYQPIAAYDPLPVTPIGPNSPGFVAGRRIGPPLFDFRRHEAERERDLMQ